MIHNLTIMDLDSIVYIIAYNYENKVVSATSIIDIETETEAFIDDIIDKTNATSYIGFYQKEGHTNYRLNIDPNYKANRPPSPDFIQTWRKYIHAMFDKHPGIVGLNTIESDDAVSICHYAFKDRYSITLAHVDKDLKCIPGTHHHYRNKKFYTITDEEGLLNFKCQVLTGDSNDNVIGCGKKVPAIWQSGPKKGESYMKRVGVGPKEALKLIKFDDKLIPTFKYAAKQEKISLDSWIHSFYKAYHTIRLLHTLEELNKFTDKKEVDFLDKVFHYEYSASNSMPDAW